MRAVGTQKWGGGREGEGKWKGVEWAGSGGPGGWSAASAGHFQTEGWGRPLEQDSEGEQRPGGDGQARGPREQSGFRQRPGGAAWPLGRGGRAVGDGDCGSRGGCRGEGMEQSRGVIRYTCELGCSGCCAQSVLGVRVGWRGQGGGRETGVQAGESVSRQ